MEFEFISMAIENGVHKFNENEIICNVKSETGALCVHSNSKDVIVGKNCVRNVIVGEKNCVFKLNFKLNKD